MRQNSLILNKFSVPKNHPLVVAMEVSEILEKELHVDDLIRRVCKHRKSRYKSNILKPNDVSEDLRVIQAIGTLIALGDLGYYKGFVYKK